MRAGPSSRQAGGEAVLPPLSAARKCQYRAIWLAFKAPRDAAANEAGTHTDYEAGTHTDYTDRV